MPKSSWTVLVFFAGICFAVAAIGSIWTASGVRTWYPRLQKPAFNPPNWVFAPVWSALYCCMAVSAWLVWRNAGWHAPQAAFLLFFVQLGLNLAWSGLFFSLHRPGLAFLDILALLATVVASAIAFRPFSQTAFWLMIPYALWVCFASLLNFELWRLNPSRS